MSLGLRLSQRASIRLEQSISLPYESVGDLELFSLHRIRKRIGFMEVHPQVRRKVGTELIRENKAYRKSSGNNWMCITPSGLDNAVYNTEDFLESQTRLGTDTIDNPTIRGLVLQKLTEKVEEQIGIVKTWFSNNYDALLYDMNGNIPYHVVKKMREKLGQWAVANTNPFQESIGSLIEEAAVSAGLNPDNYDSYEDMWKEMKNYKGEKSLVK